MRNLQLPDKLFLGTPMRDHPRRLPRLRGCTVVWKISLKTKRPRSFLSLFPVSTKPSQRNLLLLMHQLVLTLLQFARKPQVLKRARDGREARIGRAEQAEERAERVHLSRRSSQRVGARAEARVSASWSRRSATR